MALGPLSVILTVVLANDNIIEQQNISVIKYLKYLRYGMGHI